MRGFMRRIWWVLVVVAALGGGLAVFSCSSLGGEGGGGSNLPNRGITPYVPVELDEAGSAVVLPDGDGEGLLREPAAVDFGGVVLLYVERRDVADLGAATGQIQHADSDDGGLTWTPLTPTLTPADVPFALRRVGAPSVILVRGTYHMVFAVDDGRAIGYATSADGHAFVAHPTPLLTPEGDAEALGVDSPSIVADGDRFLVFYGATRAGDDGKPRTSVARASFASPDAVERQGVVFEPGTGCLDAFGAEVACWDADTLAAPEVRAASTRGGRRVFRLFYAGRRGNNTALGFAASWDGASFERFAFNPVLEGGPAEPTNILSLDRYLLLYVDRAGGIALAIDDSGQPAERF